MRHAAVNAAMNMTLPLKISWNLAARETIAGGFDEIRLEHVCMALLKLSEVPAREFSKIVPESGTSADVAKP